MFYLDDACFVTGTPLPLSNECGVLFKTKNEFSEQNRFTSRSENCLDGFSTEYVPDNGSDERVPHFSVTAKGHPKLIFNGYSYNKHRESKESNIVFWRCDKRRICSAILHLKGNRVTKETVHSHPPSWEKHEQSYL